jgi:hypothetical protein
MHVCSACERWNMHKPDKKNSGMRNAVDFSALFRAGLKYSQG